MVAATDFPVRPSRTDYVPLRLIQRDLRINTRPIDTSWVEAHIPLFDPDALGVPAVSRRKDGTYIFIDGQNRGELLRQVGWADQSILCQIYEGLTTQQEAKLFLALNDGRAVRPIYKFLARIAAEEPVATAINQIVAAAGWKISEQFRAEHITAVAALEKVYCYRNETNPEVLKNTLNIISQAWGFKGEAVHGHVLQGIGQVLLRYGDAVDLVDLTKKLAGYPGGPVGLLGDARGLRQFQGSTLSHCVSEVIVKLYNRKRRTHALPEWRKAS